MPVTNRRRCRIAPSLCGFAAAAALLCVVGGPSHAGSWRASEPGYLPAHLCCTIPEHVPVPALRNAPAAGQTASAAPLQPDRDGLRRDSLYFFGYQASTIALLYVLPESISTWSDEQKDEYSLSQWWDNVRDPAIDSDAFYLNYVLHPYWGAAYYVRARERGYAHEGAFWYSALMSASYEFGAEALFEEPSIQDLIVTPVGGVIVGHYFMKVRSGIRRRDAERGHRSTRDRWLFVLTDPLGALNRRVDRLFGRDVHVQLASFRHRHGAGGPQAGRPNGRHVRPAWGVAFSVRW